MQSERPETREGFGEATLGEAQSSDPPTDPEMIRDEQPETGDDTDENAGQGGESDPVEDE